MAQVSPFMAHVQHKITGWGWGQLKLLKANFKFLTSSSFTPPSAVPPAPSSLFRFLIYQCIKPLIRSEPLWFYLLQELSWVLYQEACFQFILSRFPIHKEKRGGTGNRIVLSIWEITLTRTLFVFLCLHVPLVNAETIGQLKFSFPLPCSYLGFQFR